MKTVSRDLLPEKPTARKILKIEQNERNYYLRGGSRLLFRFELTALTLSVLASFLFAPLRMQRLFER